ncbi:MAG: hypothetical protein K8J09_10330 [Planctomycetes bacterium]|nr:hypothetical protein [Planctomycetota bacterium]
MTTVEVNVSFRTCRRRPAELEAVPPKPVGPTPIARRIALAHFIEMQIEAGVFGDYADAARAFGISRARVTQICDLALLAPCIQAAVLLGRVEPRDRHLHAVGRHPLWTDQRRTFLELFPNVPLED